MIRRLALALSLSGCGIYHAQPIGARTTPPPHTADAAEASTNCFESVTGAEKAICASPALAAPNRAMVQALQADLRDADPFGRDALLASQRVWLLGLSATCPVMNAGSCLGTALQDRARALLGWHKPLPGGGAIAQYVAFALPPGAAHMPDPDFCTAFASRANAALAQAGTLDPTALGATPLAGSHGAGQATDGGSRISVDVYQANVFGLYQTRARAVRLDGAPVIDSLSLTALAQTELPNQGGRFSAYASQTSDYGSIDVFRLDRRRLALATDAWGSATPAAPGEFAHAGLWDIGAGHAAPLCLFDTYRMPADSPAAPLFVAWRALLTRIRDSAQLPLGIAPLRDQSQLRADTAFVLANMPLLAVQQAKSGGWTPWLRQRHDAVLEALRAWSAAAPDNKALFDQVFAGLRAAAQDLVAFYQHSQALTAQEAQQATALTIMELLYDATTNIAPGLGASLTAPAGTGPYTPRYPILATHLPQG